MIFLAQKRSFGSRSQWFTLINYGVNKLWNIFFQFLVLLSIMSV